MPSVFAVLGCLLICVVVHDAFEVMLLPRRVRRQLRLVRIFFRVTWWPWSAVGNRLQPGDIRDAFLSLYGPLSLLLLLLLWATALIFGFGILQWALDAETMHSSLPHQLYFSGVTFFTLGYGDITPQTPLSKVAAVIEAGTGLGFIAVVIGYLPVLYQLFSRREAHVIQLDARAGSPPTAATLLCRHERGGGLDDMYTLLRSWEQWSAELVESHLSYPMLSYYRSQHDNESWLAALAAVMDACALLMVGLKGMRTFQARMTFAAGRLAVVELSRVFQVAPETKIQRLTHDGFSGLHRKLAEAGIAFEDEAEAEHELEAFRNTYEPFLHGLARHLVLQLPTWFSSDDDLDNWQRSPRGRSAKRLVETAATKNDT